MHIHTFFSYRALTTIIRNCYHKTLATSVINSPISHPSLTISKIYHFNCTQHLNFTKMIKVLPQIMTSYDRIINERPA